MQGLKSELEGRVPYSVIQENLRYYDSYIMEEAAKGQTEDEVIESLGGPRIIARTIVDAALDTEDRPDGFDSFESEASYRSGPAGSSQEEREPFRGKKPEVHYVDFGKWYVRLIAGLVVFLVIFLVNKPASYLCYATLGILRLLYHLPDHYSPIWMPLPF